MKKLMTTVATFILTFSALVGCGDESMDDRRTKHGEHALALGDLAAAPPPPSSTTATGTNDPLVTPTAIVPTTQTETIDVVVDGACDEGLGLAECRASGIRFRIKAFSPAHTPKVTWNAELRTLTASHLVPNDAGPLASSPEYLARTHLHSGYYTGLPQLNLWRVIDEDVVPLSSDRRVLAIIEFTEESLDLLATGAVKFDASLALVQTGLNSFGERWERNTWSSMITSEPVPSP
jgi:hypothetical protein